MIQINMTKVLSNETLKSEENTEEIPNSFPFFKLTSFSEIKKKLTVYHKFYSEYVSNLYNHMSSNKDLRNLTIFILTIIGIIGVFLFKCTIYFISSFYYSSKAQVLDNLWNKTKKSQSNFVKPNYQEKKNLLKQQPRRNLDIFSEDESSFQTSNAEKIILK